MDHQFEHSTRSQSRPSWANLRSLGIKHLQVVHTFPRLRRLRPWRHLNPGGPIPQSVVTPTPLVLGYTLCISPSPRIQNRRKVNFPLLEELVLFDRIFNLGYFSRIFLPPTTTKARQGGHTLSQLENVLAILFPHLTFGRSCNPVGPSTRPCSRIPSLTRSRGSGIQHIDE